MILMMTICCKYGVLLNIIAYLFLYDLFSLSVFITIYI